MCGASLKLKANSLLVDGLEVKTILPTNWTMVNGASLPLIPGPMA